MLSGLAIRDIVLIERLDLSFDAGLSVLTGETGAGKSILLDALGLALGSRAASGIVRHGAERASVTATFDLADPGRIIAILAEAGAASEGLEGEPLLLRRVVTSDGRSRAYVNDRPVSAGLLRQVADVLIEIQGQFDARGLLDPGTHRDYLDGFAGHHDLVRDVAAAYHGWIEAVRRHAERRDGIKNNRMQEAFLRHSLAELEALAPEIGEEAELAELRLIRSNAVQVTETLGLALEHVAGDQGAVAAVAAAQRLLDRVAGRTGDRTDATCAALERASAELQEVEAALAMLAEEIESDPRDLEAIDDRLHELRAVARKHGAAPDDLHGLQADIAARLDMLDLEEETLAGLEKTALAARNRYQEGANRLSQGRLQAARRLDAAVTRELPALKLEKTRFVTVVEPVEERHWTVTGRDRIRFTVATNPGTPPGPINRVASGGELSRLLLALRVVLADANPLPTLVFDEVDAGVGGAVAAAVGDRLQTLGKCLQVLVVTHSPQVASRGTVHWRVAKSTAGSRNTTTAVLLDQAERREEIARMLSGARVTDAARAAAETLLVPEPGGDHG